MMTMMTMMTMMKIMKIDAPPESQDTVPNIDVASKEDLTGSEEDLTYLDKLVRSREKVRNLTGDTVETKKNNSRTLWTVIENHVKQRKWKRPLQN